MSGHGRVAIGYTRISSEKQSRHSLRAQAEAIEGYCRTEGRALEEIFEDVASGDKIDRPGLNRLRERLKKGDVGAVIVRNLDRVTRSPKGWQILIREIEEADACLIAAHEPLPDRRGLNSCEDRSMSYLLVLLGEWQHRRISDSTLKGHEQRRSLGLVDVRERFGFDKSPIPSPTPGEKPEQHWVENPDELDTLRRIWTLRYDEKASFSEIARTLNAEGRPTKRGKKWRPAQVQKQLEHMEKRDPNTERLYAPVFEREEERYPDEEEYAQEDREEL